jgi:MFS family permease
MTRPIVPVLALLAGTGILLLGGGLYGTLLAIRAGVEGFSAGTVGVVMAAYYAGFVIGCLQCPVLIQRVGHIRTYAALTAIASAASLAHAMIVDPIVWGFLRGIAGFCFAGLYMIIESWLNAKVDQQSRGRVFAVYMMVNLGALAAGQLLLLTANAQSFALFCAVSILVSLAAVPLSLTRVEPPAPERRPRLRVSTLWRISPLGLVGCAGVGLAQGVFWSLTPLYTFGVGLTEDQTAIFMVLAVTGGLMLQWPIGWLSDRRDRRAVLCGVCLVTAMLAAGVVQVGSMYSLPGLLALALLYGGTSFTIYSLAVAHANDHRSEHGIVALSASLLLVYAIGATTGPLLVGALVDRIGAGAVYGFIAVVYVGVGAFGIWRMTRRAPPPPEEQGTFVPMARAGALAGMMDPRAKDREVSPGSE